MRTVRSVRQLVAAFGGVTAFGKEIWPDSQHPAKRADLARRRKCIPIGRWDVTMRRAEARGILVTRDQLAAWSEAQAGQQYH